MDSICGESCDRYAVKLSLCEMGFLLTCLTAIVWVAPAGVFASFPLMLNGWRLFSYSSCNWEGGALDEDIRRGLSKRS